MKVTPYRKERVESAQPLVSVLTLRLGMGQVGQRAGARGMRRGVRVHRGAGAWDAHGTRGGYGGSGSGR